MDSRAVELLEEHIVDLEARIDTVKGALRNLYTVRPADAPLLDKNSAMYQEGDNDAPFFSEAYLYTLLGKGAARTVLSLINRVEEPLDMLDGEPYDDLWRRLQEREAAKARIEAHHGD